METLTPIDAIYDEILCIVAEKEEEQLIDDIEIYLIRDVIVLLESFKNSGKILSAGDMRIRISVKQYQSKTVNKKYV